MRPIQKLSVWIQWTIPSFLRMPYLPYWSASAEPPKSTLYSNCASGGNAPTGPINLRSLARPAPSCSVKCTHAKRRSAPSGLRQPRQTSQRQRWEEEDEEERGHRHQRQWGAQSAWQRGGLAHPQAAAVVGFFVCVRAVPIRRRDPLSRLEGPRKGLNGPKRAVSEVHFPFAKPNRVLREGCFAKRPKFQRCGWLLFRFPLLWSVV